MSKIYPFFCALFFSIRGRKKEELSKKNVAGWFSTSPMYSPPLDKFRVQFFRMIPEIHVQRAFPKEERTTKIRRKKALQLKTAIYMGGRCCKLFYFYKWFCC